MTWFAISIAAIAGLLAAAFAHGVTGASDECSYYITVTAFQDAPALTLFFWLGAWIWIFAFVAAATIGILVFPTGTLSFRRWRTFAWFAAAWLFVSILTEMLSPGALNVFQRYPRIANPLLVDRRFYRRQYDASRTSETFSGRLRKEFDLDRDLEAIVDSTTRLAHILVWPASAEFLESHDGDNEFP